MKDNDIDEAIATAARTVGCTVAEMYGFHVGGGTWEATTTEALAELLSERWREQEAETIALSELEERLRGE